MKKVLLVVAMAGGCGLAYAASAKPADPLPGDPVTVAMGQRRPFPIRVARNQTTLIRLPDRQRVMNTYGGDKGEGGVWSVDAGKVPTRFLAVKPKEVGIHTTLHVVSNTGQEVSFLLQEVTGTDTQFDAEVDADSLATDSNADVTAVKWVPVDEVASCKTHAEALKADAIDAAKKAQEKADADLAEFRSEYPSKLFFKYDWDYAKAEKLGLEQAWSDDKFTYFKGSKVLALYEVNEDGKPSLIQYKYKDGVYRVDKLLYNGYFAIGTKNENKLTFHRSKS